MDKPNIYLFPQLSDNYGYLIKNPHSGKGILVDPADLEMCLKILDEEILPNVNAFCYGQVESRYGSGQFYKDLAGHYGEGHEDVILSKIKNKDAILESIKDFLGKGK